MEAACRTEKISTNQTHCDVTSLGIMKTIVHQLCLITRSLIYVLNVYYIIDINPFYSIYLVKYLRLLNNFVIAFINWYHIVINVQTINTQITSTPCQT